MTPSRWQKIKTLFGRAAQQTGDLGPILATADPSVAAEVDRLVENFRQAGTSFLEQESTGETQAHDADAPQPPRLSPGVVLAGRFRVRRYVGRGGMGEVYEAEDVELGDPVALKLLPPRLAGNEETLRMFRQETQLARRVTHDNVCRVFDLARDDDPARQPRTLHFLTMEFLEGETLADRLARDGPMSPAEALPMIRQIAAALSAAHSAGVVHRDLKPANVMLTTGRSGSLRAVVMDFGLALNPEQSGPGAAMIAGTPSHMAPEQISGGAITPATDIYALGVVIYQMLAGELPFHRSSLTRLVAAAAANDREAFRPNAKGLPARWSKAILRCLEPDPAARFPSSAAVVSALNPTRTGRRVAMAALVAAAGGVLWRRPKAPPSRFNSGNAEADADYQKGRLHAQRLTTAELKKAVGYFESAIRRQPRFAAAYSGLANTYSRLNDYGGMPHREASAKAVDAAAKAVNLDPASADAQASLGLALLQDVDRWRTAESPLKRAIALDPDYGSARQWFAIFLFRLGRTREAIQEAEAAMRAEPVSLPVHNVLGWAYYLDRQYDRAAEQAAHMIDLDANFAYSYALLARARLAKGDVNAAREAALKGMQLTSEAPVFVAVLGLVEAAAGRSAASLARARELEERTGRDSLPASYIAEVYAVSGQAEDSMRWLELGFADGDASVLMAGVHPEFERIRSHPRYAALLQRFGIPPKGSGTAGDSTAPR
jgi:tetratricopeptide (TPR) repeat protein